MLILLNIHIVIINMDITFNHLYFGNIELCCISENVIKQIKLLNQCIFIKPKLLIFKNDYRFDINTLFYNCNHYTKYILNNYIDCEIEYNNNYLINTFVSSLTRDETTLDILNIMFYVIIKEFEEFIPFIKLYAPKQ